MSKIFRGNLQAVRKQIADELAFKAADETITGDWTFDGRLVADNEIAIIDTDGLADNLLFDYFRFTEGSGSASTGTEGNSLTLNGDYSWAAALVLDGGAIDSDEAPSGGVAIEFDDTDALDWTATESFAISLWFEETREGPRNDLPNYIIAPQNPTSSSDWGPWRIITSSSTSYPVTDSILFELRHGAGPSVARLSASKLLNTVYHVAVVYDAGSNTAALYVDGTIEDSVSGLGALASTNILPPTLFGDDINESLTMLGKLSEVAIFRGTISAGYISDLYNSGVGRKIPIADSISLLDGYRIDVVGAASAENEKLRIRPAGGSSEFVMTADGNVGIGITPETKLHVNGPIKLEPVTLDATPEAGKIEFADDRFYITNTDNQKVIDRTGGVITATSTLTNSTVETTLYTGALDADELTEGTLIKYFVYGTLTNATASDDITIRVYIGTTLVETFNPAIGNLTGAVVEVTGQFTTRSVGVSGSVAFHGNVVVGGFTDRATSIETIDTTISEDITVTAQWDNAKAGNTLSVTQGHVEFKD